MLQTTRTRVSFTRRPRLLWEKQLDGTGRLKVSLRLPATTLKRAAEVADSENIWLSDAVSRAIASRVYRGRFTSSKVRVRNREMKETSVVTSRATWLALRFEARREGMKIWEFVTRCLEEYARQRDAGVAGRKRSRFSRTTRKG